MDWYWEAATTQRQADYADRDGSLAKPWVLGPNRLGINEGAMDISVFQPGDTLWVIGTHTWLNFDDHLVLRDVSDLTVRGGGTLWKATLIDCEGVTLQDFTLTTIELDSGSNYTIQDMNIRGASKGIDTNLANPITDVTIQRCNIYDQNTSGIEVFVAPGVSRDNWTIVDNEIWDVGLTATVPNGDCEGIGLQRTTNAVVSGNTIRNCDYGINLFENGNGVVHDVVISHNNIRNMKTGPSWWPSRGIMMSGGSTVVGSIYNITIEHNVISDIGREGIRLQSPAADAPGLVCRENLVAMVNQEHGTPNTEHITAAPGWVLSRNKLRRHLGAGGVLMNRRR